MLEMRNQENLLRIRYDNSNPNEDRQRTNSVPSSTRGSSRQQAPCQYQLANCFSIIRMWQARSAAAAAAAAAEQMVEETLEREMNRLFERVPHLYRP
jgi:hypothetical protein